MKRLSESFVDDIIRRGIKGEERMEDSVNIMSPKEFFKYIDEKYTLTNSSEEVVDYKIREQFHIAFIDFDHGSYSLFWKYQDEELIKCQISDCDQTVISAVEKKGYHMVDTGFYSMQITKKIKNSDIIKILDTIIEYGEDTGVRKKSVNESFVDDIIRRGIKGEERTEDIPEQDPVHWWRYIELDDCKKYSKEELRSLDISFDIVKRIEKAMNITNPQLINISFKNEVWGLMISRVTSYGANSYAIDAHGDYPPWFVQFSKLSLNQKRSIKQRLEEKTFYIYKAGNGNREFALREEPESKLKKGVLLK